MSRPVFHRYLGIDYSGARTATSGLKGLRVYQADRQTPPFEIAPPSGRGRHWCRRDLADWLAGRLSEAIP